MKKTVVVFAMILAAATPAFADDNDVKRINRLSRLGQEIGSSFEQDSKTKAWVPIDSAVVDGKALCAQTIADLANLDTPGTAKVKLDNDSGELMKGEHTLDDVLPICERVVAFAKTKNWQRQAKLAFYEYPKVSPKTPYEEKHFSNCIAEYAEMMKAGIPPTYKIPDQTITDADMKQVVWGGTVEELRKKWCDGGLKNAKAETERRDAPYKKALKADKLSTALSFRSVWLPGGKTTSDPAVMAKSNVWFTDAFPGLVCLKKGVPDVHQLTRYEFDAASKLVRTSVTKYCGDPPSSAFK